MSNQPLVTSCAIYPSTIQNENPKTRAEAFLRCGGKCEACHAVLKTGEAEFDHVIPCALGG